MKRMWNSLYLSTSSKPQQYGKQNSFNSIALSQLFSSSFFDIKIRDDGDWKERNHLMISRSSFLFMPRFLFTELDGILPFNSSSSVLSRNSEEIELRPHISTGSHSRGSAALALYGLENKRKSWSIVVDCRQIAQIQSARLLFNFVRKPLWKLVLRETKESEETKENVRASWEVSCIKDRFCVFHFAISTFKNNAAVVVQCLRNLYRGRVLWLLEMQEGLMIVFVRTEIHFNSV